MVLWALGWGLAGMAGCLVGYRYALGRYQKWWELERLEVQIAQEKRTLARGVRLRRIRVQR